MKARAYVAAVFLLLLSCAESDASCAPYCEYANPDTEVQSWRRAVAGASSQLTLPSLLISADPIFASAYFDTLQILGTHNKCSEFFRGPDAATDVFRRLVAQIKKEHLGAGIAMRMTGKTTTVVNVRTQQHYRLFDNVTLNANGAFYRRRVSQADGNTPGIGTFAPNSAEIRVLIFLHELGHLMKGANNQWLLPNDGTDEGASRSNSEKIEKVCGEEIRRIGHEQR